MATQNIDFKQPGSTGDTGEGDRDAIWPINDEEWAYENVVQRPSENLRLRTEVLKRAVESLNYLTDAATNMSALGSGIVTWHGLSAGPDQGSFTIDDNIILKPLVAPMLCTPARVVNNGVVIRTITTTAFGVNPPRAYNGANKITVTVTGALNASLAATVDGTPLDNLYLTVDNAAIGGTTRQEVIDFIQGNAIFRSLGVTAQLDVDDTGTPVDGSVIWGTGFSATPIVLNLAGAVDAEQHIITPIGLAAFFSQAANRLQEGDTLIIGYDELVMTGSYGGRRQSIAELPEDSADSSGNLYNLRVNPEKGPLAIPICLVLNGQLVFITGKVFNEGESGPLYITATSPSVSISYPGSGPWADGTAVTANNVRGALDEIVSDLAGTTGAEKIGITPLIGVTAGNIQEALEHLVEGLPEHINNPTGAHAASAISYAGSGTWADGSSVTSINVEAAIDEVVSDLSNNTITPGASKIGVAARNPWRDTTANPATGVQTALAKIVDDLSANSGSSKIGYAGGGNWADGTGNANNSVKGQFDKIIDDLANTTFANAGAKKIGAGIAGNLQSTTVQAQLYELDTEKAGLAIANTFTRAQTITPIAGAGVPALRGQSADQIGVEGRATGVGVTIAGVVGRGSDGGVSSPGVGIVQGGAGVSGIGGPAADDFGGGAGVSGVGGSPTSPAGPWVYSAGYKAGAGGNFTGGAHGGPGIQAQCSSAGGIAAILIAQGDAAHLWLVPRSGAPSADVLVEGAMWFDGAEGDAYRRLKIFSNGLIRTVKLED